MDMKRFFLYAIMIAALALAGCGGGGSSNMDTSMGNGDNGNGPDPAAQLSALLTALTGAGLTVNADSTAAHIMAQLTSMSDSAKEAALATIRAALGLAGMEDADDIADEIMARLGSPTPAPTPKTNAILGAIVAPSTAGDPTTARGINYTGRPGNGTGDDVVRVRQGSATMDTMASIAVGASDATDFGTLDILGRTEMIDDPDSDDAEDMVPDATNFMAYGSEMTVGNGFTSQVYTRTNKDGDETDEINVYTNMEDPDALSWAMYYSASRDGVTGMANTDEPENNTEPRLGQINLIEDGDAETFDGSLLSSSAFPSGDSQDWTYVNDMDGTMDVNEERRGGRTMDGTFNDVTGKFTCVGDTCTVSTNEKGVIDDLTGEWVFAPADTKSMIPDVDHDSDFLAFGWWLRSVTDEDDETTYSVGTFAEGAALYTVVNAQALEGTASYSGPAAGKYGRKSLNADGTVRGLDAGHFTAKATLDAYFGGGDVAANKKMTISGSVTDFRNGNDDVIDVGWTVELMEAGFADQGNNARDVTLALETFGGATTGTGDWQGRFYGPHGIANDPDTDANEELTEYPTGVAGEFTGHFSNGHVIGAFGATKD